LQYVAISRIVLSHESRDLDGYRRFMVGESGTAHASTLRDYVQIARRRRWTILATVVLVPAIAAFLSLRQEKLYRASADVLVSHQNLPGALTGTSGFDVYQTAERVLQTQADVATTSPQVATRVRNVLGLRTIPGVDVKPKRDSNILIFSSTARNSRLSARVASEYARQFTEFQRELAAADIDRALQEVEAGISELVRDGVKRGSALYSSLVEKREQLRTLKALQTSRAFLVRPAKPGVQVQPKPVRNTVLALVLGIIVGLGLALLREALDTGVRSTDEIAERLGLPLLARLPAPPKRLRREARLVMIDDPDGPDAEAFRILRTNLEFVRADKDARTLVITSAVEEEGKSTTAANLAVALARVGQRVALVDLDLRRPSLHVLFDIDGPGVTEVAIGRATLDDALVPIPLETRTRGRSWNGDANGMRQVEGLLEVLPAGPMPPNVDEFLTGHAVAGVLSDLRRHVDVVLIDSTPLLVVSDAMALTAAVDAVVAVLIVTRMNVVRRPMLRELRRVLDAIPAQKLGFVATGVGTTDSYYHRYVADQGRAKSRAKEPVT
jgi:Mrp family chromosome partitioning ATPase/capsular polysaccharide biosynthesis protein